MLPHPVRLATTNTSQIYVFLNTFVIKHVPIDVGTLWKASKYNRRPHSCARGLTMTASERGPMGAPLNAKPTRKLPRPSCRFTIDHTRNIFMFDAVSDCRPWYIPYAVTGGRIHHTTTDINALKLCYTTRRDESNKAVK